MKNIKQNLFAFLYNALGVPIAASVLTLLRRARKPNDRGRSDGASALNLSDAMLMDEVAR